MTHIQFYMPLLFLRAGEDAGALPTLAAALARAVLGEVVAATLAHARAPRAAVLVPAVAFARGLLLPEELKLGTAVGVGVELDLGGKRGARRAVWWAAPVRREGRR